MYLILAGIHCLYCDFFSVKTTGKGFKNKLHYFDKMEEVPEVLDTSISKWSLDP